MADVLTTFFGMTNPEPGASSDSWGTKENADRVTVDQLLASGGAWVAAGGTADAITATYSPALLVLADGVVCAFRALGANTTTTPSFAPNGLTARTIVKDGGLALAVGDIPRANYECVLRYNLPNTRWELLNPATLTVLEANATGVNCATTGTAIATVTLTPGRWRVSGNVAFNGGGSNATCTIAINSTSGSIAGTSGKNVARFAVNTAAGVGLGSLVGFDVTVAANTPYYVNGAPATGSDTLDGYIRAERIG